jgi:hypothetical protein
MAKVLRRIEEVLSVAYDYLDSNFFTTMERAI